VKAGHRREAEKIYNAAMEREPVEDDGRHRRKLAPWWMYAIAAAFLICASVRYYAYFVEPEDPGILWQTFADKSGHPIGYGITAVQPGSAAARAGLEPGDTVLFSDSDGFFAAPEKTDSGPSYWETGRTYRLEIKRKEAGKTILLTLNRNPLSNRLKGARTYTWLPWAWLILAGFVAFARSDDLVARWGALAMATNGINLIQFISNLSGLQSTLMSFPRLIVWSTLLPSFCGASFVSSNITFCAVFPRRLFQKRWIWALIWLPTLIVMPRIILSDHAPIYSFSRWWPDWYDTLVYLYVLLGILAWGAVVIFAYLRLRDPNERRRFRIFAAGFALAPLAGLPLLAAGYFPRIFAPISPNLTAVFICFVWVAPISMAYAILRHRVFDIRVMVRLGLRYAAARGVLLSLVPLVAVILAGDLLLHQEQPLKQILSDRGLLYTVLAGGAFLLHIRRRAWLDAIDRRFFRERYDAQRVLRGVVEEIRAARSFPKVAPQVVSQIEAALHPEFAAILMRHPGDAEYQVLAARENAPPPIPADSKLVGLVRLLGKPVEVSPSQTGWLRSQLPRQESEFLRQARMEWLFPICLAEGQTEALLAVGPKRSEEPYSHEDQELLQGITSSLALLLEQSPSVAPAREGFEECPTCGACYDTGSVSCTKEGARLLSWDFPRLLANRYRFDQRLGEGGMGTVYQAFDTELERQVAVKLIRSDLTASSAAAARFKQEAKAAASFTHPNVVTVFDFGVAEGQRAYLVMELLRGLTLRQELTKNGRVPAARASEILSGVCAAVDAAHRRRLLHRDIKPENIFLANPEGTETAKILDFGVVKTIAPADTTLTAGQTGPGVLVGTLRYMSPEQLRGEEPAESWDLWALAVVAYEMLAGAHPFAGSTVLEAHNAILGGHMTPLGAHVPDAPPAWQGFFDQALSPRADLRSPSALQLFAAFNQSIQ
jgi:hypothetical protein